MVKTNPYKGNELSLAPTTASVTVDHLLGSLERHLHTQINQGFLQTDAEARCIRHFLTSFRRTYEEDLATPRQSLDSDSPETRGMSSLHSDIVSTTFSLPPQEDLETQIFSTVADGCVSAQQNQASVTPASSSNGKIFESNKHGCPPNQAAEDSQEDNFSFAVFDFETLPDDAIFSPEVTSSQYGFQSPRFPELEQNELSLDFGDEEDVISLENILSFENDWISETFLDTGLKTKHHGNLQLQKP